MVEGVRSLEDDCRGRTAVEGGRTPGLFSRYMQVRVCSWLARASLRPSRVGILLSFSHRSVSLHHRGWGRQQ